MSTHPGRIPNRAEVLTEEFIDVYMAARTISEVASRLGITRNGVHHRARTLRLRGVRLPYFREPLTADSVAFLNRQIAAKRTKRRKVSQCA